MEKGGGGPEKGVMMPWKILSLSATGCHILRLTQLKGNNQFLKYTASSPWREMELPCFPKPCTQATQVPLLSQKVLEKYICLKLCAVFFFFFWVLVFVLFVLFEGGNSVWWRDETWHAAINSQWASYIFRQFWELVILLVFWSWAIYHVGLTESWDKG